MSNCKLMLPPPLHDHRGAIVAERRATTTRVRRMGISVTEMSSRQRAEVRAWAATLTEIEVEEIVESEHVIRTHDGDFDLDE